MTTSEEIVDEVDTVTSPKTGCNGSVILFVVLLSSARVALGFSMNVFGLGWLIQHTFTRKNWQPSTFKQLLPANSGIFTAIMPDYSSPISSEFSNLTPYIAVALCSELLQSFLWKSWRSFEISIFLFHLILKKLDILNYTV